MAGPGEEALSTGRVVDFEAGVTGSWAMTTKPVALSVLDFVGVIACALALAVAISQPLWLHADAMDSRRMDP